MESENNESEHLLSSDSLVPILVDADDDAKKRLLFRMTAVVDRLGSRKYAAEVAGVSPDMLAKYLDGSSRPRFDSMAKLALTGGVSLDWLATGEGPMRPDGSHWRSQTQYQGGDGRGPTPAFSAVSTEVSGVKAAVALAVAALGDHGQTIRPERLAELIDAAHQALQAGTDPALVRRLIAAAANP